jgi:hypothetical protein
MLSLFGPNRKPGQVAGVRSMVGDYSVGAEKENMLLPCGRLITFPFILASIIPQNAHFGNNPRQP